MKVTRGIGRKESREHDSQEVPAEVGVRYPGRVEQVRACPSAPGLAFLQEGTKAPLRGRQSPALGITRGQGGKVVSCIIRAWPTEGPPPGRGHRPEVPPAAQQDTNGLRGWLR